MPSLVKGVVLSNIEEASDALSSVCCSVMGVDRGFGIVLVILKSIGFGGICYCSN